MSAALSLQQRWGWKVGRERVEDFQKTKGVKSGESHGLKGRALLKRTCNIERCISENGVEWTLGFLGRAFNDPSLLHFRFYFFYFWKNELCFSI